MASRVVSPGPVPSLSPPTDERFPRSAPHDGPGRSLEGVAFPAHPTGHVSAPAHPELAVEVGEVVAELRHARAGGSPPSPETIERLVAVAERLAAG